MALPTSMKAMKAAKATPMKPRVMKAKRFSKIARGRFAKAMVFRGSKQKTVGGLTKEMLMKNKRGKVVSKKASAASKRKYKSIEAWTEATASARRALQLKGFTAINGKSVQGKALYVKAKALLATASGA
ncbi:unnamed protein product [Prorocentrum cordatum]|uniref:50S ribosomal protein L35 n=1 Tax=Prorocentrum cordatum TaxID=2364126 RepID=A0ABN9SCS2_9DINO|nr:unnamed protein product [Polarella glacialis]